MAKILDKQRYKCAMSAMQTVQAIERAILFFIQDPAVPRSYPVPPEAPDISLPIFIPVPASMSGMWSLAE